MLQKLCLYQLLEATIVSADTATRSDQATECKPVEDESTLESRCWPEWWRAARWAGGPVARAGVAKKAMG